MDKAKDFAVNAAIVIFLTIALIWIARGEHHESLQKWTSDACHSITEDSAPFDCNFTRIGANQGVWHK